MHLGLAHIHYQSAISDSNLLSKEIKKKKMLMDMLILHTKVRHVGNGSWQTAMKATFFLS